jgi:Tol biopolymer transport system component
MTRVFTTVGVFGCLALVFGLTARAHSGFEPESDEFGPWSEPVNLGPIVNSSANDAAPYISRDGLSLYFHSSRNAAPTNPDIYVSRRKAIDLPWEPPVNLGPIVNSGAAEAGPMLTRNGRLMVFASARTGNFDLYATQRRDTHDDFAWDAPVALPAPINGPSFDVTGDFFETPDGGLQLYFSSDRANGGGVNGLDIWVSEWRNGTWSDPQYVSELNSAFQDARPAISKDGLEIIFASGRTGNLDLYVSRRRHIWEAWSAPENLGPVLNTAADDIQPALSANDQTLYFASSRSGNFDLYASTRSRLHGHHTH